MSFCYSASSSLTATNATNAARDQANSQKLFPFMTTRNSVTHHHRKNESVLRTNHGQRKRAILQASSSNNSSKLQRVKSEQQTIL